ncbi:MAG: hypothetical protein ACR2HE_03595 [Casimicrobiaceae bacterium]
MKLPLLAGNEELASDAETIRAMVFHERRTYESEWEYYRKRETGKRNAAPGGAS